MNLELFLDPTLLLSLAAGSLLGIAIGAIPGLTATLAIALLLPLTYQLSAANAIVMMVGIFTGGLYGGSIAAIALRIPGAPANAMTMLDGNAMALQGRTGTAIGIATFSSVVGGLAGGLVLVLFSPQLARIALRFQSPEMFALVVLALVAVATVSRESLAKGMAATVIGLMLSTVGIDPLVPVPRYTLGSVNLLVGLPLIPVVIGIFAFTELYRQASLPPSRTQDHPSDGREGALGWWREVRRVGWRPFVKNSVIGTSVGALPGAGGAMAAFLAYSEARRSSPEPDRFGKGAPEGIVAPEVANNAVTGGALIPLLALGIPGDSVTAVILGGLVIHGITPGPQLFTENADLVAPLFAAFFASYLLILVFGLTLLPLYARITRVPRSILFPAIAPLAVVAAFTSERTTFAIYVAVGIGILGYVLRRFGYPVIPVLLGLILGPMLESNFRRALILSDGDPLIFISSPISVGLLLAAAGFLFYVVRGQRRTQGGSSGQA
ncbi:MAG: tripartite tricarboxylate transporter permease [Gammaproteobacteria bacterium]|nr:tripartite tricarboxylate transporter permease [Gammaproteobacteria bacterium]